MQRFSSFEWHSEPPEWSVDPATQTVHLTTAGNTDFWQRTHYGFQRDNGHFFYTTLPHDFVMAAKISFNPTSQYDQAGLMVRTGPECWIKTSVEYEPGRMSRLGAVVTKAGYSDWSTQDVPATLTHYQLQIRREHDTYTISASIDERPWMQIRLTHLPTPAGEPVKCGIYACSPNDGGMQVAFESFTIEPPAHA